MQKIDISAKTIIFTIFLLIFLKFLWLIKDLLFSLLIAFILMSALRPQVKLLENRRIPHSIAVFIVYFLFLLFFVLLFSIMLPPIIIETGNLIKSLPFIIDSLNIRLSPWIQLESVTRYLPDVTNQLFKVATGFLSNAFFILSTLFFGFYFLLEGDAVRNMVTKYLDEPTGKKISNILEAAESRMSSWFWGQLTLMFVVGLMSFIGLSLLGIKYVIPLAVLAGLLEVVPNIGPIISAVPAVLLGMSSSYIMGFSVAALYLIVQQLENNLIVPMIMRRAVGLNPIITLAVLVIGGRFGGILGVLLAIPAFLFIETIILELIKDRKVAEKAR